MFGNLGGVTVFAHSGKSGRGKSTACHVYDVEADTPQKAHETLEGGGEVEFLHEANEPAENHFFTEVYEYDAEGDPKDDPEFVYNPACAKVWRELAG